MPKATHPARILFLAANPASTQPLALAEEIRSIEEKLRSAEHRDAFALVSRWAARPDDLLQALNELRPTIVHISGHGDHGGGLLLHGVGGTAAPVAPEAVASLFRALRDDIRVVVFNTCDSLIQAEATAQAIDCVIGMDAEIGDEAARVFAAAFYRALGFGRSVQAAFDQGRVALELAGIPEDRTPRILTRPGVLATDVFPLNRPPAAPQIAVLAARADQAWLRRVQMHLKPVARKAGIVLWDSSSDEAGAFAGDATPAGLRDASVVVLLVTADLLVDDDFIDTRLPALLAGARSGAWRLLSLIISGCAFKGSELSAYKPLNDPEEPLDTLPPAELNQRMTAIATRIVASAARTK